MQVINWFDLQPLPADLDALNERLQEAMPLRKVCQFLVETTLCAYPWVGRADLIPCYHPSKTYTQGQKIALLISDSQNVRPTVWQLAQVKQTKVVENPIQERFQVITLEIHGKQIQMAGGIAGASYPEPDFFAYTSEALAWLVKWFSDTYATALETVVKNLIQKGRICGQLVGQTFLPEHVSALSMELLHPIFARISPSRPWISLAEILRDLPDLSQLEGETVLGLLRATLKGSSYQALGADRWTAPELFHQLNREVPRGLPISRSRSNGRVWTKQDEQDLPRYDTKFMPAEARGALEELGFSEKRPEPDASPWRPPNGPLQLPALNYLHITQAYFPVGSVMHAFAPDVHLVLVQFIDGDHQPCLLDRENRLLKAVHPEELCTKFLTDGIPAGTHLWLEYQENERYRIAPRLLPFKRMVPCKLAHLENRQLHIEHTQISMMYEGNSSLFKANLCFEDLKAMFAEASRVNLSLREAIIYAMQAICRSDPSNRAHWLDILNAVFLQRMCSPSSVLFLLYTQPCFEQLGGGYFRYKPMPDASVNIVRKRRDRVSQLWNALLSDPVAPDPVTKERTTLGSSLEDNYSPSRIFAPAVEVPSLLRHTEAEPEISVTVRSSSVMEDNMVAKIVLKEEEPIEALVVSNYEENHFTTTQTDTEELVNSPWRQSLEKLYHSLVELQKAGDSPLSEEEANSETEALSDPPVEASPEESSSFPSPFRWEPPGRINVPTRPLPPLPNTVDTRHLVYRSKIPLRPLHKRRFYQRLFFYLHNWLSTMFRKAI